MTSWIPERVAIKQKTEEFRPDEFFMKISERHRKGDVLANVATGEMSDKESERTGLVSTHAYALLDVREVQGKKLFLLKNPWSHMRWKGHFSERDTKNWTPALKTALSYNPESAAQFDNGKKISKSVLFDKKKIMFSSIFQACFGLITPLFSASLMSST